MTARKTANRNFPFPNEGGFGSAGTVVFESGDIRASSPPGQRSKKKTPFAGTSVILTGFVWWRVVAGLCPAETGQGPVTTHYDPFSVRC